MVCDFGKLQAVVVLATTVFGLSPLPAADCNQNGVEDAEEVSSGAVEDCNGNTVPDSCELTPLDFGFREEDLPLEAPPRAIVTGDFSGDGFSDIVTGNRDSEGTTVSVFLSLGSGDFESRRDFVAASALSDMKTADLDGDGDLDLAASGSSMIQVLRNAGDGTFGAPEEYEAPRTSVELRVADVTGDGAIDIVTVNRVERTVSIHANQGDGTFGEPVSYEMGRTAVAPLAADLNGDGAVDLAATSQGDDTFIVRLNDGSGAFLELVAVSTAGRPFALAAVDLDSDGDSDLLTGTDESLGVWLNPGDGKFASRSPRSRSRHARSSSRM